MNPVLTNTSVRILGPIEAWHDDRRLDLGGPRQLALFAYLLLHANQAVPSKVLLDTLWGTARTGADHRLNMAVARLRRSLAPLQEPAGLALRTMRGGYLLTLGSNQLDATKFAELVQEGLRTVQDDEPALASTVLSEALALWRGPALAEVGYEDFAQGEIRRLEEVRRAALEARIDAQLRLGRHRELVGELGRLLAEHPLCERISAQLMLALYRSDRQADALDVYDRTRLQLSVQLGLEPGATLKALQADILNHADSLNPNAGFGSGSVALPQSPLTGPSHQLSRLSDLRDTVHSQGRSRSSSKTLAENCSTRISPAVQMRWRGSSKAWYHESWTVPRQSMDGSEGLDIDRAA
jgi:DNA-binding SARP family transcriptional activator